MLTKSDLVKKFNKSQLFALCEELGVKATDDTHSYTLIDKLTENLADEGLPEPDQQVSKPLSDFLIALGYWAKDSEGNIVLVDLPEKPAENISEKKQDLSKPPTCFGAADPIRDPGCVTCPWKDACWQKRLAARASIRCFGKLYSAIDEGCKGCLEMFDCKELTAQNDGVA